MSPSDESKKIESLYIDSQSSDKSVKDEATKAFQAEISGLAKDSGS